MLTKPEALIQIASLIKKHHITMTEIQKELDGSPSHDNASTLKKLFGFLGGIFIFCGIGIYTGQYWGEMNSAARIIITLGTGIALLIMAVAASFDVRYEKVFTPLFILSAFFQTSGMFVTCRELFHEGRDARYAALVIFATMLWQQLFIFWKIPRTNILFFCLLFGTAFLITLSDLWGIKTDYAMLCIGLSISCITYGIQNTRHHSITPFWYFIGSSVCLIGLYDLLQNTWCEVIFLAISTFVIFVSTQVSSRTLLLVGTIAMISYIGYFTEKHLLNSVGWPIALIGFGIVMLGASAMAFNLSKSIKSKT